MSSEYMCGMRPASMKECREHISTTYLFFGLLEHGIAFNVLQLRCTWKDHRIRSKNQTKARNHGEPQKETIGRELAASCQRIERGGPLYHRLVVVQTAGRWPGIQYPAGRVPSKSFSFFFALSSWEAILRFADRTICFKEDETQSRLPSDDKLMSTRLSVWTGGEGSWNDPCCSRWREQTSYVISSETKTSRLLQVLQKGESKSGDGGIIQLCICFLKS